MTRCRTGTLPLGAGWGRARLVPIARRNILSDKAKFLLALGGVTLSIVLILVVNSLYQGAKREVSSFIRSLPGDVWVTQQGTTDLVFSNSHLPEAAAADIRGVPGVAGVHRLYGRLMAFEVDGEEVMRTYVMSFAPDESLAIPEGSGVVPEPGTIIIDNTFASETGLSPGETVTSRGSELTVAEVRHVGNVLVTQFAFVHPVDFGRLFGIPDTVNFFLVSLGPDATEATTESIAQQVEGSSAYTTDQFARRASNKGVGDFLPIIRVIMAISFIVGLAVLSLTIYSATIERVREYAILKVLGASPLRLYRIVLSQSTTIAVLGFGAGVGLAFLFNRVAGDVVPQFITYIRWRDVVLLLGVTALMTFVSTYLPINRVARVDPASVFRA